MNISSLVTGKGGTIMGIAQHRFGDAFDQFVLIKTATKGTTSNGKPFLTLILRDATGEIEAKLWDASEEDEALYRAETIIHVSGEIIKFRNKPQLRIQTIRIATDLDGVKVSDFVEKSPVSIEALQEKINEAIFEMENPTLQRITRAFIRNYQDDFFKYPAAANIHHEYASGLAHHTVGMIELARQICRLYPEVNRDLLYAGVILHDIGKLKELSGILTTSYTVEGRLLGHITIMVDEIGQMAKELKIEEKEEVLVLQHLVLTHHGKPEWGSPKQPIIREAELLHLIDLIDARMNMLNRALDKTEPGEFTERLFGLDQRAFYKPLFE